MLRRPRRITESASPVAKRFSLVAPRACLASVAAAIVALSGAAAHAHQATHQEAGPAPCAVVEDFGGSVQLMDPTRTHVVSAEKKAGVSCGGWVSVGKGWVKIAHRDGYRVKLASGSFAQFSENNPDGKFSGDAMTLFKGQAYGQAADGAPSLNVITANARARIAKGSAIVIYNHAEEETQLISLDGHSNLENRFEPSRRIKVSAGEASELNFKQLRVVPTVPRALAMAALRGKLSELQLDEKSGKLAVRNAASRQERRFAAEITAPEDESPARPDEVDAGGRGLASVPAQAEARKPRSPVIKTPAQEAEEERLRAHFVKKLSAGENVGQKILFPSGANGRSRQATVQIVDPAAEIERKSGRNEEKEKRRLIEELSRIRPEE